MTIERPGDAFLALLRDAKKTVVIISPFIKAEALKIALAELPNACGLIVVTRWRPDEIRAGVSDIEVWNIIQDRANGQLWLCDSLHAKYYRVDQSVLIGSANLTGMGMGWRFRSNIELLRHYPFDEGMAMFEQFVITNGVQVSSDIKNAIEAAVALLPEINPANPSDTSLTPFVSDLSQENQASWFPRSRWPSNLWLAYSGQTDRITTAAREDAETDLRNITLPIGLSEATFHRYVASILVQQSIVVELDKYAQRGVRFGEIREALRNNRRVLTADRDSTELLQTLIRWMTYFMPDLYEIHEQRFTEVLVRKDWK